MIILSFMAIKFYVLSGIMHAFHLFKLITPLNKNFHPIILKIFDTLGFKSYGLPSPASVLLLESEIRL